MENLENEIWVDVKGYEGLYQVSNLGRVKSLEKIVKCGKNSNFNRVLKSKILRFYLNLDGYYTVNLTKNKIRKNFNVHYIVCSSFNEKINGIKNYVNHKNENKIDNRVENLEFCSNRYNLVYSLNKKGKLLNSIYKNKEGNFLVRIRIKKTRFSYGTFKNLENAICLRDYVLNNLQNKNEQELLLISKKFQKQSQNAKKEQTLNLFENN